jgi:hypothetical protein
MVKRYCLLCLGPRAGTKEEILENGTMPRIMENTKPVILAFKTTVVTYPLETSKSKNYNMKKNILHLFIVFFYKNKLDSLESGSYYLSLNI